mgnify:CR=1 FL=1
MNFRQRIQDIDYTIYGTKTTYYTEEIEGNVDWEIYIESRSWGVKGISVYVTDFNFEIRLEESDPDNFMPDQNIKLSYQNIEDLGWSIETEGTDTIKLDELITIQDITVDIESKLITIIF